PGFSESEVIPVRIKVKELSPKVSVCIITNNDQETIEKCLKSVIPVADEIIIIDKGSTDKTKEICMGLNKKVNIHLPLKIILFQSDPENDQSKLKNQAFNHAKG